MYENYYAVIMAGGGGTRLWPLSRKDHPKQMLTLGSERSLFQVAVDRLNGIFPSERILVVTVENQVSALQEQVPEIPSSNYLLEPIPRGTASVVGYAASVLNLKNPQSVMAVLTADHIIGNLKLFQQILTTAFSVAENQHLVTLGISPTYPATGYGYIKKGQQINSNKDLAAFQVEKFIEKPDLPAAEKMAASPDYVWNSGMFFWKTSLILEEIRVQMPDLHSQLGQIREAWDTEHREKTVREVWPSIQPQTIDFGIMENAQNVAVIPARELDWNDVGSWEALFDLLPQDDDGNIVEGADHLPFDTKGTIIYGAGKSRLVVTIGVEDLIIVDTGDVLLVCSRDQAQDVRRAVKGLMESDRSDLI